MAIQRTNLGQAVAVLRNGASVVFPTDTVYGLGVSVGHAASPRVLFELKGRSQDKPVAWLVGDPSDLKRFSDDVPSWAESLAKKYWPGPLTLVVRANDAVPASFQSDVGTIGLRMPDNSTALELIEKVGFPLATTSANMSGDQAPFAASDVNSLLLESVGAFVQDDSEKSGLSSTVVDCTGDSPVVLREGSITALQICSS